MAKRTIAKLECEAGESVKLVYTESISEGAGSFLDIPSAHYPANRSTLAAALHAFWRRADNTVQATNVQAQPEECCLRRRRVICLQTSQSAC